MSLSFLADHAIFIVFYSCLLCSRISPFNFIVPSSYEAGKSANNCKTLSSFDINVSQGLIVGSVGGFPRRNRHERPILPLRESHEHMFEDVGQRFDAFLSRESWSNHGSSLRLASSREKVNESTNFLTVRNSYEFLTHSAHSRVHETIVDREFTFQLWCF